MKITCSGHHEGYGCSLLDLIRELPSFRIKLHIKIASSFYKAATCFDGPTFAHYKLPMNSRMSNRSNAAFRASSAFAVVCKVIYSGMWNLTNEKFCITYHLLETQMNILNLIESGHVLMNLSNCRRSNIRLCAFTIGDCKSSLVFICSITKYF